MTTHPFPAAGSAADPLHVSSGTGDQPVLGSLATTSGRPVSVGHGPGLAASVAFLLLGLPLGIVSFTLLVTLISVGVSTAIIWVGLPVLAAAVLVVRGLGRMERERVAGMLGVRLPEPVDRITGRTARQRWQQRLEDGSTWSSLAYLLLLFPLGIIQFTVVVTLWATGLGAITLPIWYRFLPEGAMHFPSDDEGHRWLTVDSWWSALPWSAAGVLVVAVAIVVTRGLVRGHVALARNLLAGRDGA
ncbi:sensor domain-containing protein [Nakamurella leprariae]|uniref:Sensor domain-containing protein n=1 Tax=Nakamurella leprariae TaxID=2803911 RepID=A0A939BUP7_9ACTN|nr:sensor domain-containing protein [Nakamurella leprariae]MBM9465743.1 sensor domain-containing protein [Nakamurella leprariae]